jgi:hypothetical protein
MNAADGNLRLCVGGSPSCCPPRARACTRARECACERARERREREREREQERVCVCAPVCMRARVSVSVYESEKICLHSSLSTPHGRLNPRPGPARPADPRRPSLAPGPSSRRTSARSSSRCRPPPPSLLPPARASPADSAQKEPFKSPAHPHIDLLYQRKFTQEPRSFVARAPVVQ